MATGSSYILAGPCSSTHKCQDQRPSFEKGNKAMDISLLHRHVRKENKHQAFHGDDGKQYLTNWTKSTDVFAMGWLIREICGDFFIDMSREEKLEYDREKWNMGYPTTSEPPHQTHRLRLKDDSDAMLYRNISSLRDHRKIAEYWTNYLKFTDLLMVDPTICMRPIESKQRVAKHQEGPRDIKENKW
ncbi:hypothetical protein R1sor_024201 [Riccia sorocarpa]|uniref:Protein kinase domain-containing protein n=1 Tax=Riccia sorocarpa TaxID=122646 RepID=A0ABD3GT23_9MARC